MYKKLSLIGTKNKIFLVIGVLLTVLFVGIIWRYFVFLSYLPVESQSVAYLQLCLDSGGEPWTGQAGGCGHNLCWGGVGVQQCGYG